MKLLLQFDESSDNIAYLTFKSIDIEIYFGDHIIYSFNEGPNDEKKF